MSELTMIDICLIAVKLVLLGLFAWKSAAYAVDLLRHRGLLIGLAKNDLRFKYAGSALGIVWAFAQPVLTTLIYWFVFQLGFKSRPVENFPFILWLVSGLCPWFYFGEALVAGTGSIQEYSYLVKKVMFHVDILPAVKAVAGFAVQIVFILFVCLLYVCYGIGVSIYALQLIYYSLAMLVLALGFAYLLSSLQIFMKDVIQVVSVLMQLIFWSIPIVWNLETMPESIHGILKLNPLYYIVEGYRDALINRVWFWEKLPMTLNYWLITAFVFALGTTVFRRLKPHFADVL